MSQSDTDKTMAAEERSEETRSFVRRVRSATRRKYSPEEKIRIVLEGFRREVTVNDLCRREGIKPHSVSNQQKWDTLRPERSGVGWRSGELPEGPVVASSPFDRLSLHLLPAL